MHIFYNYNFGGCFKSSFDAEASLHPHLCVPVPSPELFVELNYTKLKRKKNNYEAEPSKSLNWYTKMIVCAAGLSWYIMNKFSFCF